MPRVLSFPKNAAYLQFILRPLNIVELDIPQHPTTSAEALKHRLLTFAETGIAAQGQQDAWTVAALLDE